MPGFFSCRFCFGSGLFFFIEGVSASSRYISGIQAAIGFFKGGLEDKNSLVFSSRC